MNIFTVHSTHGTPGLGRVSAVHSGNMGDVVYAVPTLRALGVDTLYLNCVRDPAFGRRRLTRDDADFIAPLLRALACLERVHVVSVPIRLASGIGTEVRTGGASEGLPLEHANPEAFGFDYVLDRFRLEAADRMHLIHSHARAQGLRLNSSATSVPYPDELRPPNAGGIVLSLTPRARYLDGAYFAALLRGRSDVLQIGAPSDAPCFAGISGTFRTASDSLELARIIAGADVFVGSQSMPAAIAEVLAVPRLLDVPDYPAVAFPVTPNGALLPVDPGIGRTALESMLAGDSEAANRAAARPTSGEPYASRLRPTPPSEQWRVYWHDTDGVYDDSTCAFVDFRPSNLPKHVVLPINATRGVRTIRLHTGKIAGFIEFGPLTLTTADGIVAWQCSTPARNAGEQRDGLYLVGSSHHARDVGLKTGADAWFELAVPDAAGYRMAAGGQLNIEIRYLSPEEVAHHTAQALETEQEARARAEETISEIQLERDQIKDALERERVARARAEAAMSAMQASTSWRVTEPIRGSMRKLRRLRLHLRPRSRARSLARQLKYYLARAQSSPVDPGGDAHLGSHQQALNTLLRNGAVRLPLAVRFYANRLRARGASELPQSLQHLEVSQKAELEGRLPYPIACIATTFASSLAPTPDRACNVDIIVCVHNALDDVRRCLESVIRYWPEAVPTRLIVVDDGSGAETRAYLAHITHATGARLIRHATAQGYTAAANAGMTASTGDLVVLLNSDTVVTARWIERLFAAANSDQRIGMLGPLSNTASWQSVPEIFHADGDWAANELPEDYDLQGFASEIAAEAVGPYPRVAFVNGFCLAIKRRLIEDIGMFNPAFANYGEENDYCLRATRNGWVGVIAHDAYVYHAQSRSYDHAKRAHFVAQSDQLLRDHHPSELIVLLVDGCRKSLLLANCRARTRAAVLRTHLRRDGLRRFGGRRVVFLLPATDGGGVAVVMQEVAALARMGVAAEIVNLVEHREVFLRSNDVKGQQPYLTFVKSRLAMIDYLRTQSHDIDIVVCTHNSTVEILENLRPDERRFSVLYYVQDYEPFFYAAGSRARAQAERSYTALPELQIVTKSGWNARTLATEAGVNAVTIGPSVDLDLFWPRRECGVFGGDRAVSVAAMVRPTTPRRAPQRTYAALRKLAQRHGRGVQVYSFGCTADELTQLTDGADPSVHHLGVLTRAEMADLLGDLDVFFDLSHFQAMGLTAIEAMASGCHVIAPAGSGASDFIQHGKNGVLVDPSDSEAVHYALDDAVQNGERRQSLQHAALEAATAWPPERAAHRLLDVALNDARSQTDGYLGT